MLLMARLVQGLAHGGELPSSQTYLSEIAPSEHRGFWGKLSDRIGRKKVLWSGAIGAGIMHFPMTALLKDSAWQVAVSMSVMLIFIAASAAIVPAVYAELFPTSIRTVGVGVPYSICVALFGGTAPYLQQWLGTSLHMPQLFNVYAVLLLAASAVFVFTIPETKGKDLTV
ncbi:MFS family permease [Arthrobacter sp. UYEF3]